MNYILNILRRIHVIHSWKYGYRTESMVKDIRICEVCKKRQVCKTGISHVPDMGHSMDVYWWETVKRKATA